MPTEWNGTPSVWFNRALLRAFLAMIVHGTSMFSGSVPNFYRALVEEVYCFQASFCGFPRGSAWPLQQDAGYSRLIVWCIRAFIFLLAHHRNVNLHVQRQYTSQFAIQNAHNSTAGPPCPASGTSPEHLVDHSMKQKTSLESPQGLKGSKEVER